MACVRWLIAAALLSAGCVTGSRHSDPGVLPATHRPPAATHSSPSPIVGIVLDSASARPLSFSNVIVIGTKIGTQTDASGMFTLVVPDTGAPQVQVMRPGYERQTRTAGAGADRAAPMVFRLTKIRLPEGTVFDSSARY